MFQGNLLRASYKVVWSVGKQPFVDVYKCLIDRFVLLTEWEEEACDCRGLVMVCNQVDGDGTGVLIGNIVSKWNPPR